MESNRFYDEEDRPLSEKVISTFKEKWVAGIKEIPVNINPGIALATILFPNALFIIAIVNERIVKDQQIEYPRVFFGILVGLVMSFLFNGGSLYFKSLTQVQAFILIAQIKSYGIDSLHFTGIGTGLVMFMVIYMKVHKVMRSMPYCLLVGFRFSLGKIR
jgi:hypothetical protein